MNSTGNDIQRILTALLADRPYAHGRGVDAGLAAVITVERDLRFLPDTLRAVLGQTLLPGMIVVVDCSGSGKPVSTRCEFVPEQATQFAMPSGPACIEIRIIPIKGATSFGDAVTKGIRHAGLPGSVHAWWLLHDDSRPADDECLARLSDAWRNNPTASLLGAKQLDWRARDLHNVGMYAGRHRLESLVVDGEEDQEQYDSRQDVFAVSLAGALVPVRTFESMNGISSWLTTYGESADFCRRICLDGGRVVVVPAARIAHRRARYEGIRTRSGESVEDRGRLSSSMAVMAARQRYLYTDIRMVWWPLLWLWRLVCAVFRSLSQLFSKRPLEAWCEMLMPWVALLDITGAVRARRQVSRNSNVPLGKLTALSVTRQQLDRWKDRARALEDQHYTILLSPLARTHLRQRRIRRWTLAGIMVLTAFLAIAIAYRNVLASSLSVGASLYSDQLLPTSATFGQLVQAATTAWSFASTGSPAPPAPWLLVWMCTSVITFGHPSAALTVIFFAAAPLSSMSFWALAGIFTRSNGVRVAAGLLWTALAMATGLFDAADLPMLTVMVFMPAAFAFSFRAVGMYRTEDQLYPHGSVQSAALAALCFVPVVASEPQLLLPLVASFLVFLLFVRRHRVMLLLIPVPSAFVIAPTLVNAVKYMSEGVWRQLFGDMTIPLSDVDGRPSAANLIDVVERAFAGRFHIGTLLSGNATLPVAVVGCALTIILLLAVVALFLPFALRASRLMWTVALSGAALALVCSRVLVSSDSQGDVAASVLPGFMLMMLGLLSCVCLVAGNAAKRFMPLRRTVTVERAGKPLSGAATRRALTDGMDSDLATRTSGSDPLAVHVGRTSLIVALAVAVVSTSWVGLTGDESRTVRVSESGLPMVASDYLSQGEDHRILALHATSDNDVEFTVLRSARGDLVDSSPVRRVRLALGSATDGTSADAKADRIIAKSAARLLAGADAQSIRDISQLGFAGMFVSLEASDDVDSAAQRLISNVTASEGTQAVVAVANGTYYRLTIDSADRQNIDTRTQRSVQSSPWRYAWLICMSVIVGLYALVALPHRTYRYSREEA